MAGFLNASMNQTLDKSLKGQLTAQASTQSSVIRQQVRPLCATVGFDYTLATTSYNVQTRTAFVDLLNQNQASNVQQTHANHTYGGSATPSGTRWYLLGMGIQWSVLPATLGGANVGMDPNLLKDITQNTSVKLKLGQVEQALGNSALWPGGVGPGIVSDGVTVSSASNGYPDLNNMVYFYDPIIVEPQTPFQIELKLERIITTAVTPFLADQAAALQATVWFPRVEDFNIQQKAGA
jgi:hypothetical protein|tara:strand:+ start:83 stop:793 length:711 start_codon:yes stop_codon:yes gene_type:complete